MIYDHQDMSTKYYIVDRVRAWVGVGDNAMIILQNPKLKEYTQADLSWNSTDDIVWSILYLIGVGMLRYVVSADGREFDIAENKWKPPTWLFEAESMRRLNNHIDFMMELDFEGKLTGVEPTALLASLEMIKYKKACMSLPKEPVKNDLNHERTIMTRNQKTLHAKRAFHRRR
jgi:hypothetical protein